MRKVEIKQYSDGRKSRGNNKFQTFKNCEKCGVEFGPVKRLKLRFCSKECWYKEKATGHRIKYIPTKDALRAQRMVRYRLKTGEIIKPKKCEFCNKQKYLEGAHTDYKKPLDVKWLCISCHRKYDKKEKKNGSIKIERWQQFTGKKAELLS